MTGKIKSFSPAHGYGFIDAGKDIYFHRQQWLSEGLPMVGQDVFFLLKKTDKGLRAFKIRRLS